ncbi:hypothetical protein CSUI_001276 [Cystoisospora suis]|uniref:Uncharacterized protein n=1 Tax=Cystoisospora suis TaxID=483139 RepID=A0A2C6KLG5_9APIC|nr:hypothetical protein CSUI_001276 [Cystoisospora suis]
MSVSFLSGVSPESHYCAGTGQPLLHDITTAAQQQLNSLPWLFVAFINLVGACTLRCPLGGSPSADTLVCFSVGTVRNSSSFIAASPSFTLVLERLSRSLLCVALSSLFFFKTEFFRFFLFT